jgi:hypothetical protein
VIQTTDPQSRRLINEEIFLLLLLIMLTWLNHVGTNSYGVLSPLYKIFYIRKFLYYLLELYKRNSLTQFSSHVSGPHQLSHHYTTQCTNFKMINLTRMISIFNSIFYHCVLRDEINKKTHLHIFKELLNQLNFLYICIYLYLQHIRSYGHTS